MYYSRTGFCEDRKTTLLCLFVVRTNRLSHIQIYLLITPAIVKTPGDCMIYRGRILLPIIQEVFDSTILNVFNNILPHRNSTNSCSML